MTTGRINLVSIVQGARGLPGEERERWSLSFSPGEASARPTEPPTRPSARTEAGEEVAPTAPLRGREFLSAQLLRWASANVPSIDVVLLQKTLVRRQVGPTRSLLTPSSVKRGGVSARARGGRALPEASLESVLGGEGRGAQTETPAALVRAEGQGSRLAACARPSVQSCGTGPSKRPLQGALLGPHRLLRVGGCGAYDGPRTYCPEGINANLRSRPGLSKQLSQGRDRIDWHLMRPHSDARSSETPLRAPASEVRSGSRAAGRF